MNFQMFLLKEHLSVRLSCCDKYKESQKPQCETVLNKRNPCQTIRVFF